MHPISWIAALACVVTALFTVFLLEKVRPTPLTPGRYQSIDGLRGYLALFVFLHHACIWYFFLLHGDWEAPPSRLFTFLGEGSVALFFMITAFLFYGKLLDARAQGGLNWTRLFLSRVMRLFPLYALAMACVLVLVGIQSEWTRQEPLGQLLRHVCAWLYLSLPGSPPINGIAANIITAGVTWSLPYEWVWYFCLPAMAWTLGLRPTRGSWLLAALVCGSALLLQWTPHVFRVLPFAGGIAATYAARSETFRQATAGPRGSVVVLVSLILAPVSAASAYKLGPLMMLTLAFCIIASGNSLFGLLHLRVSRALGEMAYSIYLLHGLLLFTTLIVLDQKGGPPFSATHHWGVILALTPVLIILCRLTYLGIERPGNRQVDRLTRLVSRQGTPLTQGPNGAEMRKAG